MKYVLSWYDEKFEVTEKDKELIERGFDENVKFVVLSNNRQIDPMGVRGFKPIDDIIEFRIDDFNEDYKAEMLKKLGDRKKMFRQYLNGKETQPWKDLIAGLKKKDTRKPIFQEKVIFKENGTRVEKLLEFSNKTNRVRVVNTQTLI